MQHDYRLVVHVKVFLIAWIRIRRPPVGGDFCLSNLRHQSKEIVMGEQHRLIGPSSQTRPSLVDKASLHQGTISTGVVIREGRINDGANGLVGNLPDGG